MKQDHSNASLPAPFDPLDLAAYGIAKPIEPKGYFAIAIRYVHPPRVEWMENEGVANYRLLLLQDGKVLGATEAKASPAVAVEGWDKTRPGKASVAIEGYDTEGKRVALSRIFPFYIVPDFSKEASSTEVRTPAEAAWLAFDALSLFQPAPKIILPQDSFAKLIPAVVFSATVGSDGRQHKASYPVLHNWLYVDMCEVLLKLPAEESSYQRVREFARGVGEHILRGRLSEDYIYGGMILGCTDWYGNPMLNIGGLDEKTQEKTKRLVEPAKCAYAAEALLKLYEMLGETRFLEAAVKMAEVLVKTQAGNGSWPTRVDGMTGEVLGTYGTSVAAVISFLARIETHKPDQRWAECSSKAMDWMIGHPLRTFGWVVNYEDNLAYASEFNPYAGLSNWDLFHFVRHVAKHPSSLEGAAGRMNEQMEWNDNHFVFYGPDPLLPFDPWVPSCAEQGNPSSFISPGGCWLPMDFHTANWGRALLAMYRLTGEKSWMEKARAASATLTNYQLPDGRTLTWMPDRSLGLSAHVNGNSTGNFWPAGWAAAAAFWAELAGEEANTQTVVYKTVAEGDLELDIDFPPNDGKSPVILYAHSWSGNKNQLKAYSVRLAQEGVAGVRINYRKHSDGHSFEQAISDVRDAFQWIRDNAEKYHFDTERMGIAGASAGGLLSALVALENKDCRIYIGFNGGYDLVQKDGSKWPPDDRMETLLAGKNTKKALQKWSAIHQIPSGNLPAVLLLHGTKDETITIEVARRFQKALTERGGIAVLGSFEGEEHGFFNANLPRFNEIYEMVYKHVMKYLVNTGN